MRFWHICFFTTFSKQFNNPWSITSYLDKRKLAPYWASTSSNALVSKLIQTASSDIKQMMEELINGREIVVNFDEQIVFGQLDTDESAIWSLLLASGYLKPDVIEYVSGDIEAVNYYMNKVASEIFSFFDVGGKTGESEPERFYHGFVLGLMAEQAESYEIRSNRESGFGRYDIMMIPKKNTLPAIVIEFKVHNPRKEQTFEDTVNTALKQIEEKNYDAELIARGISKERIKHYGFAFEGKNVLIAQA